MDASDISRRRLLGAAGVAGAAAAVGLAAAAEARAAAATTTTTATGTSQLDEPRLPLNVLLLAGLSADRVARLRELSPQLTVSREVDLASADVVFGPLSRERLARAPKLRWVQWLGAGVEHAPLEELIARDVILTNAQGCYAPEIAEHVFALLFALTRGIAQEVRRRSWGYEGPSPVGLRGMTMGIIGLGGIGRETARRAKAMDMKVIAVDAEPMLAEKFACVDEVSLVEEGLTDLLKRADVLVLAAPHTPRTRGMIGAEQLAAMKKGSYLINVARGPLVKTGALLDALTSGHLAGAGLDVTDPEPLPADHPLWRQPNVVITSHIAGRSQFSWDRVQDVFTGNVARFVHRLPMVNVVDKRKGY